MGGSLLPPWFVKEPVSNDDLKITTLVFGITIGICTLTIWKAGHQTVLIWKRTHRISVSYFWMIWLELLANILMSIIAWMYMGGMIAPRYVQRIPNPQWIPYANCGYSFAVFFIICTHTETSEHLLPLLIQCTDSDAMGYPTSYVDSNHYQPALVDHVERTSTFQIKVGIRSLHHRNQHLSLLHMDTGPYADISSMDPHECHLGSD
jgi:hypothetical protein